MELEGDQVARRRSEAREQAPEGTWLHIWEVEREGGEGGGGEGREVSAGRAIEALCSALALASGRCDMHWRDNRRDTLGRGHA